MTLSDFIFANMEAILVEWEEHARTLPSAGGMDPAGLRDQAGNMLSSIAHDMRQLQGEEQQEAKSKVRPTGDTSGEDTAAAKHGGERLAHGFDLDQMVSEFRALRASVVRLWTRQMGHADRETLYELTRFNEAIDKAWAESIARYSSRLGRSRELLLGMLGHDLRNPLGAISLSAKFLADSASPASAQLEAASRIRRSSARMERMISDLLDVTRTRLGGSLPVAARPMDLAAICREVVDESRAVHPNREVTLSLAGDLRGVWDEARLAQVLSNLVENAVQHGVADAPVTVSARREGERVRLAVHNRGAPIPESMLARIFAPLVGSAPGQSGGKAGSLGLGLYIAREIVLAHGGSVDVTSSEDAGTTFTVCLPCRS